MYKLMTPAGVLVDTLHGGVDLLLWLHRGVAEIEEAQRAIDAMAEAGMKIFQKEQRIHGQLFRFGLVVADVATAAENRERNLRNCVLRLRGAFGALDVLDERDQADPPEDGTAETCGAAVGKELMDWMTSALNKIEVDTESVEAMAQQGRTKDAVFKQGRSVKIPCTSS
jgi:hypothetical protein